MHLSKECFKEAMESLDKAELPVFFSYDETSEMWTLSLVRFSLLKIQIDGC